MKQFVSILAFSCFTYGAVVHAATSSAQKDSYDLKKINQTIESLIQPLEKDYPLVKELTFKLDSASVKETSLGGSFSFQLKTDKSSWSNTPTGLHFGAGANLELVEPAKGDKKGLANFAGSIDLGLETQTLAMFNHIGELLYSPDDCKGGPDQPSSCAWYKGLKDAKNLADLGQTFTTLKTDLVRENKVYVAKLYSELKALPENSPEYKQKKSLIAYYENFGKILEAVTIVNKTDALTVKIADLWWDADKKAGIKQLDFSLGLASASVLADLRLALGADTFVATRAEAVKYLEALEKADDKVLQEVKDLISQYVSLALQIIVGD